MISRQLLWLAACLLAASSPLRAADPAPFASNQDEFLPVDEAFRFDAYASGPDRVALTWQVAKGYYLYRSRMNVAVEAGTAPAPDVQLGALQLPRGEEKEDEFFGRQEVYHQDLEAGLPLARAAGGALLLPLKVTYQGCADAGLCYPPETKTILVSLPAASGAASLPAGAASGAAAATGLFQSQQDQLAGVIRDASMLKVLSVFFGLGLLLAFTPCVLPMVPILSGIIAGQGSSVTPRRAFALSLAYVLGMAVTYTIAGTIVAMAGFNLTAAFQNPWIVGLFAALFVALAMSMFGFYTIQTPAALQSRLSEYSNELRGGTYAGVALMGALSALIVSACVAPPLIAALIVIGQTGDAVRGGAALFAMALGMGAPLLVVGASAGHLLPRAGAWMDTVKHFFGVLMLLVAVWVAARLFPPRVALVLWAIPAVIAAVLLWRLSAKSPGARWTARTVGTIAALYGASLLVGAAIGAQDPLKPLARSAEVGHSLPFKRVKSVDDLKAALAAAQAAGRGVMLDFYADWCVSCKEMERYTFSDPKVQAALANSVLLQADVTANDDADKALLKSLGSFGAPTIAFFGSDGAERREYRVVGFMKAAEFEAHSRAALGADARTAAR
jgi:thiol:disulfide interchange protein DsbD